jgi:hypothetical protein
MACEIPCVQCSAKAGEPCAPECSRLRVTEPSAPAMTAEEARERLEKQRSDEERLARGYREMATESPQFAPGCAASHDRDAAALALAIRALELVPKLAACGHGAHLNGHHEIVNVPRTTWDDLRALAAEGGRT